MKDFGRIVKLEREDLGISQRELAEILNVDNSYIARIEIGEVKKPSVFTIYKLCFVFGINLLYMLFLAGYSEEEICFLIKIGCILSLDLEEDK